MTKCMPILVAIVVISGIVVLGCQEPLVGAPCVPETDKGIFTTSITEETYSVETRSVQCETTVCITRTNVENQPDLSGETVYDQYLDTQLKYSFCSCRCATADGETYDRNDDQLDDLCTCPGASICDEVLPASIEGIADNIAGYYCVPDCILNGCETNQASNEVGVCSPSDDDEAPWAWSCESPS